MEGERVQELEIQVREPRSGVVLLSLLVSVAAGGRITPPMTSPAQKARRTEASQIIAQPLSPQVLGRIAPEAESIEALITAFSLDLRRGGCGAKHAHDTERAIREYVEAQGIGKPEHITTQSLLRHLDQTERQGWSAKTRRDWCFKVSAWLDRLVRDDVIPVNPMLKVPRPKVVKKRARIVPTLQQLQALVLASMNNPKPSLRWLWYLVAAQTGLRSGAMHELDWSWVHLHDLENGPCWIEAPAEAQKNGKEARIFLTSEIAHLLDWHRRNVGSPTAGRVFRQVKLAGFNRDLAAAGIDKRTKVGGPTLAIHSLRHFAATYQTWAAPVADANIARQMGHSASAITRAVYIDAESYDLGRRIWLLQPLMPPDFVPPDPKKPRKRLDRGPNIGHHVASDVQEHTSELTPSTHPDSPPSLQGPGRRNLSLVDGGDSGCVRNPREAPSDPPACDPIGSAVQIRPSRFETETYPTKAECLKELLDLSRSMQAIAGRLLKELDRADRNDLAAES